MSYILEALRRADAERERGAVPGLHTRADPRAAAESDGKRGGGGAPWGWIVVGVAAGLAVALALSLFGGTAEDAAPVPVAQVQQPQPPRPVARAEPSARPAPVQEAPSEQRAAPPTARAAAPAEPPAQPSRRAVAQAAPAQRAPGRTAEPAAPREAAGARSSSSTSDASNAPDGRIYAIDELPDEIRRDLPQVAIGGSIYSIDPTNRFLIINGQTFRERDLVAPELSLEQIRLKAAVLKFRGYRYRLNY